MLFVPRGTRAGLRIEPTTESLTRFPLCTLLDEAPPHRRPDWTGGTTDPSGYPLCSKKLLDGSVPVQNGAPSAMVKQ